MKLYNKSSLSAAVLGISIALQPVSADGGSSYENLSDP